MYKIYIQRMTFIEMIFKISHKYYYYYLSQCKPCDNQPQQLCDNLSLHHDLAQNTILEVTLVVKISLMLYM